MPAGEQFRAYYPGLVPSETRTWRAWLREHELEFGAFEYDLHVGKGVNVAPRALDGDAELQERMRQMFLRATQRKIDCVGYREGEVWIFEVEERATPLALGQLLMYEALLPEHRPLAGRIELALVARRVGEDMLLAFERQGITVYRVDVPG